MGKASSGELTGAVAMVDAVAAATTNVDIVDLDVIGWMVAEYNIAAARADGSPTSVAYGWANNMATLPIEGVVAASTVVSRETTLYPPPITDVLDNLMSVDCCDHCGII
jgi:hypothetical protein